jgi:anthranilate phosphoribosyltransferase
MWLGQVLNTSISEGIEKAKESLKTNKALEAFNKLKNLSE